MKIADSIKWLFSKEKFRYFLFGVILIAVIQLLTIPYGCKAEEISNTLSDSAKRQRVWMYKTADLDKYLMPAAKTPDEGMFSSLKKKICDRQETGQGETINYTKIYASDNNILREKKIITMKLLQIKLNADRHLDIAVFIYKINYLFIIMASMLGIIAAALIAYISKAGWEQSNKYTVLALAIIAAHAAFYYSIPNIFEFQKNIAANVELYTQNVNLENEVMSCLMADKCACPDIQKNKNFITYIDNEMRKLNIFSLTTDLTKMPVNMDSQTYSGMMGGDKR